MATRGKGHPGKLTAATQQKIIAALRTGVTYDTACQYAGIDYSTMRRWVNKGEDQKEGVYRDFCDALKKAEADAEIESLARIRKAGAGGQWQADAWILERRYPQKWGRRDRQDVTQTNVNINWDDLTEDELERIAAGEDPAAVLASRSKQPVSTETA